MPNTQNLQQLADSLGIAWSDDQMHRLRRYQDWLIEEAIPAGGLGPHEGDRIFDRHIADSLTFLRLIGDDARTLLDVGSGVGLPAIPIAIARPPLTVTIVDRAERRTRLARRALRILGLTNVDVQAADIADITEEFDVVTFRASLPVDKAASVVMARTARNGVGLLAWSRIEDPREPPPAPIGMRFELINVGAEILDSPSWLLKMQGNH